MSDDIKRIIIENMNKRQYTIEEIRLQKDLYQGWNIVVISKDFDGLSFQERKDIAFRGIDESDLQWVDLLTPEESEIFGSKLPIETDIESLPLWPEALARKMTDNELIFASDIDDDLDTPIVTTFYSLRGGVGRSTALTYTAHILAKRGFSVLCIDMDLEAPGLASLFNIEHEVKSGTGLLNVIVQLEQGEKPNLLDHIIRVSSTTDLYCLPAGLPDANYARMLRLINPESWYQQEPNPLRELIELIKSSSLKIDVVLMDSRTGISPTSAPLLFDLSDISIIGFYPHPQSEKGTNALVQALLNSKTKREVNGKSLTPEIRFLISPIPPREIERYQQRAIEWIQKWFEQHGHERLIALSESEIKDMVHVIPYRELIASSDHILHVSEIFQQYNYVADWISKFLSTPDESIASHSIAQSKESILKELVFSVGAAEQQDDFLETFVPTAVFHKACSIDRPLVIGRKGTGKTALFRWIVESKNYPSIVVMCASPFRKQYPWVLSTDGFAAVEGMLNQLKVGWREFWMIYMGVASYFSLKFDGQEPPLPGQELYEVFCELIDNSKWSELDFISALNRALSLPQIGLLAWDWLLNIDLYVNKKYFALFDGLDTGFGNSELERERRKRALEGLFSFVIDREKLFENISFKLLLREDIWNKLRFENKSHLNVRIVKLEWRYQVDYIRTVIKQALRSNAFKNLANNIITSTLISSQIEHWPDEAVIDAWNLLVGERMKGGKSTYTITWIWNRLADGNGDHSPRALFHLFNLATRWEEQEQRVNPYEKSVIRARALYFALEQVSYQSLQSLLEEFEELEPLSKKLAEIGRSPIEASMLGNWDDQIALAREVGLLEVYEESEEEVRRYRVPDLYRVALRMTRKGQL